MTNKRFNEIVEAELINIKNILVKKADEYNLEKDRLGFFKRAAIFSQSSSEKVLYGFLLKHLQSITDMINSEKKYPKDMWLEKITDIENYLILLIALLEDNNQFLDKENL